MTAGGRYFCTGTDTGVGKTLVSAALLHRARVAGRQTAGIKPVAAGCSVSEAGLRNDDALALLAESNLADYGYDDVNPVALEAAVAPHLAAAPGQLRLDRLLAHCRRQLDRDADAVIVEGAGGWLVPIDDRHSLADLAERLALPVILVVGMRLGCINHALLTTAAVHRQGLRLAGWVANCIDPEMAMLEQNIDSLRLRLPAPLLGTLPLLEEATAAGAAGHLRWPEEIRPSVGTEQPRII